MILQQTARVIKQWCSYLEKNWS